MSSELAGIDSGRILGNRLRSKQPTNQLNGRTATEVEVFKLSHKIISRYHAALDKSESLAIAQCHEKIMAGMGMHENIFEQMAPSSWDMFFQPSTLLPTATSFVLQDPNQRSFSSWASITSPWQKEVLQIHLICSTIEQVFQSPSTYINELGRFCLFEGFLRAPMLLTFCDHLTGLEETDQDDPGGCEKEKCPKMWWSRGIVIRK